MTTRDLEALELLEHRLEDGLTTLYGDPAVDIWWRVKTAEGRRWGTSYRTPDEIPDDLVIVGLDLHIFEMDPQSPLFGLPQRTRCIARRSLRF